jgi:hypothetical protein
MLGCGVSVLLPNLSIGRYGDLSPSAAADSGSHRSTLISVFRIKALPASPDSPQAYEHIKRILE